MYVIPKKNSHTLFSFALSVGAPVYTSLDNLIFALELVLVLVLKVAHFLVVNIHLLRTITALEGGTLMPNFCRTFRHGEK